ncbi:hypothetical protein IG631_24214 [Alternaria alternata]|nr:hypothetical protein IG631_24214 [Alternaria alternata]
MTVSMLKDHTARTTRPGPHSPATEYGATATLQSRDCLSTSGLRRANWPIVVYKHPQVTSQPVARQQAMCRSSTSATRLGIQQWATGLYSSHRSASCSISVLHLVLQPPCRRSDLPIELVYPTNPRT